MKKETPAQSDSTEQRIFDAAHEVFTQRGLDGAKMQEIADRAGINKALLHYYYRSKEKLYEAVARVVISQVVPAVRDILEGDAPLSAKLERFIDLYVGLVMRNPYVPMFVISEINKHPDRFFDVILPKDLPRPQIFFEQVEAEVAAGRLRPINPKHLIVNVVSLSIFPVIAKPMARILLGLTPEEMQQFLNERKEQVKEFVFAALRP